MPYDRRHLILTECNLRSESLSLDGQVHNDCCSSRRILRSQSLNRFVMHMSVSNSVEHTITGYFYSRMRHYRDRHNIFARYDATHPFGHIDFLFHVYEMYWSDTILSFWRANITLFVQFYHIHFYFSYILCKFASP